MTKILNAIFVILLSSCAVKVNTFYDKQVAFDQYQTFCWFTGCQFTIEGPDYLKKDSAAVEAFKQAIVQELNGKGYRYDDNQPDFLLYVQIVVEEQQTLITSPVNVDDAYDWGRTYPQEDFVEDTYVYLKGSMIIDIADAASGRMVWRSDAVRYLALNPEIDSKTIAGGVKRALRKFPPR